MNTSRAMAAVAVAVLLGPIALAATPTKRPTDMERGKELYERHCIACHGAKNRGDGPATEALVAPVPDLVGKVKTDEPTNRIVMRGQASMPGYETSFDREDGNRVLKYMASLPTAGRPPTTPAAAAPAANPAAARRPAPEPDEGDEGDARAPDPE